MLTAQETIDGLRDLGFTVRGTGDNIVIDGPIETLDERRREIIRYNKQEILALLACTAEAEAERDAIRFADTSEAERYLDYAAQLFGPGEMRLLDTPKRLTLHKQGLVSGVELDAWLAQCNHEPHHGTWHEVDGVKCCRYCGGLYEVIMARRRESVTKTKSQGAATPRLF